MTEWLVQGTLFSYFHEEIFTESETEQPIHLPDSRKQSLIGDLMTILKRIYRNATSLARFSSYLIY